MTQEEIESTLLKLMQITGNLAQVSESHAKSITEINLALDKVAKIQKEQADNLTKLADTVNKYIRGIQNGHEGSSN